MRTHRIRLLTMAAAALCAGAAPATAPVSPIETERATDRDAANRQVAEYTLATPTSANRAVMLGIEHGRLSIRSTVRPTLGFQRIQLTDIPGLSVMRVRQLKETGASPAPPGSPFTPDFFMFTHYDFSEPQWSQSLLTAAVTPMNLQLALDSESPKLTRSVSLVQTSTAFANGEPSVRLRVTITDKNVPTPLVNIERVTSDFVTLRRDYPEDSARYVEPILHALHADASVFSPEPKLIWEVFADDVPTDPATAARVKSLIALFDADDYHDREAAAAELNRIGEPAALALMRTDRTTLSPEAASRVDSFLAPYQPVPRVDAVRLGKDVNFLLDCLFDRDPAVVHDAAVRLSRLSGRPVSIDASVSPDARRDAIAELRRRLAPTNRPTP